jgi:uncharacterized protein (TIGR00251 family)
LADREVPQPTDRANRASDDHTTLTIHVQPRARQTAVVGWHGDAIKIRLAAPPVDGAANDALQRFLADRLGVPKHAVTIAAGHASRRKRVTIDGRGPTEVFRALGLA